MSRRLPLGRRLLIALVLGGVAAFAGQSMVAAHQSSSEPAQHATHDPAPGDLVRTVAAGVRRTHFYVSPELRRRITPAQQRAVEDALTSDHERPERYLMWLTDTYAGGYASNSDAAQLVADQIGRTGFYVVVNESMEAQSAEVDVGYDFIDPQVLQQRPGDGLLAYAQKMGADVGPMTQEAGGDGVGSGFGGLFLGGLGFGLVLLVAWVLGRSGRAASGRT